MAALSLLLGSIDLTSALKVAKDEGMDPAAPGFLTPEFSSSPFADGNPLTSVSAGNREQAWPLIITAATKPALAAAVQQINLACAAKQALAFRDQGFDDYSYFDVVFARFDVDYNYRRQAKNWVGGLLRVWTKPYATTGTSRVVGTVAGASGIVVVPVPTVLGDAPPEVTLTIRTGTQPVSPGGRILGAAVVPSGFPAFISAASLVGSLGVASWTPDGYVTSGSALAALPPLRLQASAYAGRNRVLALVKANEQGRGVCLTMSDIQTGAALGPTAIVGQADMRILDGFQLADLGIVNVSTDALFADVRIGGGPGPYRYSGSGPAGQLLALDRMGTTGPIGYLGGLVILPEDTGYLLAIENAYKPRFRAWFGGSGVATSSPVDFLDDYGNGLELALADGGLVSASAMALSPKTMTESFPADQGQKQFQFVPRVPPALSRRISAMFGFVAASMGASYPFSLIARRDAPVDTATLSALDNLRMEVFPMPSPALSITVNIGGGLVVASVPLQATTMLGLGGTYPLRAELYNSGSRAYANLALRGAGNVARIGVASCAAYGGGATSVPVACVGFNASQLLALQAVKAVMQLNTEQNLGHGMIAYSLSVDDLTQPQYTGSDAYTISDHDRTVAVLRGAGSAGVGIDGAALRGDGLTLTPGRAQQVVVFGVPQDSGRANDLLDVTVRVRERFSYLR